MRLALTLTLALGLLAFAVPADAVAPVSSDSQTIYENGGYCRATIHTACYHETALGLCVLYLGGPNGSCIIYEG
ncbi:MAG: hypothetical protein QOD77_1010 [Thermoplasmata archaeon]|jgi:opacity protein-like surface antigen|nr:hypothetical protein [Thermoplasmata archaeon]